MITKYGSMILKRLESVIKEVDDKSSKIMMNKILKSDRVFIYGMGRSGLVGKAFAMRLMHCGKRVFVVGGITTPPIKDGDILLAISGSGETESVVSIAGIAKKNKASVIALTSNKESRLAKLSDHQVIIKGRTKADSEIDPDYMERQIEGEHHDLTPMGTLFELSCLIFLDSFIAMLIKEEEINEKYMKKKHANLE